MTEITREVVTTQERATSPVVVAPVVEKSTGVQTVTYLIYFVLGVVEILLAFRLVFKLMGASSASSFVSLIYAITGVFILPFEGIFSRSFADGIEATAVLEPATMVAMIVYAVLAWVIVKLIHILSGEKQVE